MTRGPGAAPDAAEHYFAEAPRSRSSRHELRFLYRGELLRFVVDRSVFASHGLDPGTALLIESMEIRPTERVLDLGCGWGALGVAAAKAAPHGHVVLTDINRRALALARENLELNRIRNAEVRAGSVYGPVEGERFDVILSNPPYHAGRSVVTEIIDRAPEHLAPGGTLMLVGKGSQGIRYYQSYVDRKGSQRCEVLGRGSGYRVIRGRMGPPISQA